VDNLSVNTLRNHHSIFSFPKSPRFPKIIVDNTAQPINLPSIFSAKKSSMGYGEKCTFYKMAALKNLPSPFHYNVAKDLSESVGKTFGISRELNQNVYVPGQRLACLRNACKIPGPTKYSGLAKDESIYRSTSKISLKGKLPPETTTNMFDPPPNNYSPSYKLVKDTKFDQISFGVGKRSKGFDNLLISIFPGPSTYIIPTKYDNFKRISKLGKSNLK